MIFTKLQTFKEIKFWDRRYDVGRQGQVMNFKKLFPSCLTQQKATE